MNVTGALPHRSWRLPRRRGGVALGMVGFILALAVLGPLFAPHSPSAIVGAPATDPSGAALLGTDFLGRDVLSRVLWGGRSIVVLAGLATLIAYLVGATIGLVAGYSRSFLDPLLMRAMDVLLAFPPILFLLVLATGAGSSPAVVVIGIATIHVPGVARLIRTATLDASVRGYVEAAVARGERLRYLLFREILPNIRGVIVADGGPRLTVSILLVASLNFLGLGLQPPAADWALMISENRVNLTIQPWAVVAPAVLIAILTIAVNIVADEVSRGIGRSGERAVVLR